jgi:hypothetical protein
VVLPVLVLVLALGGCGGKAPPAEAGPKGPAPCERVGDHLVGLMTAGLEGARPEERPTEVIDKLTKLVIELCAKGGWSPDAQQCFLSVRSLTEDVATWDRCAGYLTVEQRDALPKAIDAAFGKPAAPPRAGGAGEVP